MNDLQIEIVMALVGVVGLMTAMGRAQIGQIEAATERTKSETDKDEAITASFLNEQTERRQLQNQLIETIEELGALRTELAVLRLEVKALPALRERVVELEQKSAVLAEQLDREKRLRLEAQRQVIELREQIEALKAELAEVGKHA